MSDPAPLSHAALFAAPIPRRFPPLVWRRPAALWAPVAVVLGLGWPALALRHDGAILTATLIAAASACLTAGASLSLLWLFGRPPRARRMIVAHWVGASLVAAFAAPIAFGAVTDHPLSFLQGVALAPLALMLGLPTMLFAGLMFSWVAMVKPARLGQQEILLEDSVPQDVETYEITRDPAAIV